MRLYHYQKLSSNFMRRESSWDFAFNVVVGWRFMFLNLGSTSRDTSPAYRVEELAVTSTAGLLRIAVLALMAFAVMTVLTWDGSRGLTLVVGGLIVGGLLTVAAWYRFQERYSRATLFADQPFNPSSLFHGYFETDEHAVQHRPIRVELLFYLGARGGPISLSKQSVSRDHIRNAGKGEVHIPFTFPPASEVGRRRVIVRVRTQFFPLGWGATFAVWPPA